jgi:hypothetical protein
MLKLDNVTLIALTSLDYEGHKRALDLSSEGIEWGAKKIIWDETIKSIDDWNYKVIFDLWRYVDTDFAMLIHADGYVVDPSAWRDEFLEYDYIGAPWPLPMDDYSYRDNGGNIVRVGNSVSLRSKKILGLPYLLDLEWKEYYGNTHEDGYLTCHQSHILKRHGVNYAPLEIAKYFSKEHELPENQGISTFAFHTIG